jgi:hypothetical protein
MRLYELMVALTAELWRFLTILPKPQIACTISQQQQQMSQGKFICTGLDFEQKVATVQYYMAEGNGIVMKWPAQGLCTTTSLLNIRHIYAIWLSEWISKKNPINTISSY